MHLKSQWDAVAERLLSLIDVAVVDFFINTFRCGLTTLEWTWNLPPPPDAPSLLFFSLLLSVDCRPQCHQLCVIHTCSISDPSLLNRIQPSQRLSTHAQNWLLPATVGPLYTVTHPASPLPKNYTILTLDGNFVKFLQVLLNSSDLR